MVINTNTSAESAARLLSDSTSMLQKSLAKLSSGSKIVSPEDDAAGLAVSTRFDAQVNRIGAGRLFEVSRILNVPVDFFYEGVAAQGAPGMSEPEGAPPVMEFVSSGEGLQLSIAFMKIKDAKVRKRVLDLVKSLAEEEEQKS